MQACTERGIAPRIKLRECGTSKRGGEYGMREGERRSGSDLERLVED